MTCNTDAGSQLRDPQQAGKAGKCSFAETTATTLLQVCFVALKT
jgi:hypothetical protein